MKFISIVTPCYNEEGNVEVIYNKVKEVFAQLNNYTYEHIFIDNSSNDNTVAILKSIAAKDNNVKIIVNTRNFGALRSQYHALLQARGDAIISIVADLQDPPNLIFDFLKKWEEGYKIVVGVITRREKSPLMSYVRNLYYAILDKLSDTEQIKHYTGFGLYDKSVIEILRGINDQYPYFRGLIAEIGIEIAKIEYVQPVRYKGKTTTNLYVLFNLAVLGITNYSKIPLRLATMLGFISSLVSLFVSFAYLLYKLIFWSSFTLGIAPLITGLFFFLSVQLFFLGILGEYIGSIHTQVLKRPLVIEKERVNFSG